MDKNRIEYVSFYSKMLGKESAASVYVPKADKATPVLYFLHGRTGDESTMFELGLHSAAEEMILSGEIAPCVIVCPRMENSRGVNSALICRDVCNEQTQNITLNLGRYEDYLIQEVLYVIENKFNISRNRKDRYIGGVSAGGYAALHNAFRHQELFSKAGAHMPALELKLEEDAKPYFKDENAWRSYDPISIAKSARKLDLQVYLDAGDEDEGEFYRGCAILYDILKHKGVKAENHVFPGRHNAEYIKSNLRKYLKFYAGV